MSTVWHYKYRVAILPGLVQSPKTPGSRKYEKITKKYKIPHPGDPRKYEKIPKKYENGNCWALFCIFSVFFSYFRGPTRGGGSLKIGTFSVKLVVGAQNSCFGFFFFWEKKTHETTRNIVYFQSGPKLNFVASFSKIASCHVRAKGKIIVSDPYYCSVLLPTRFLGTCLFCLFYSSSVPPLQVSHCHDLLGAFLAFLCRGQFHLSCFLRLPDFSYFCLFSSFYYWDCCPLIFLLRVSVLVVVAHCCSCSVSRPGVSKVGCCVS